MTFESFRPECPAAELALAECFAWAKNPVGVLILTGGYGTGKTHLAVAIIRAAGGRYMTLADMVAEIQAGYGGAGDDTQIVKALGEEPLLALDEAGRQRATEDARYQIQRVMDERYILERPTVLATNLPPQGLADQLGPQIADRIAECRKIVRFEWPSWRRQ